MRTRPWPRQPGSAVATAVATHRVPGTHHEVAEDAACERAVDAQAVTEDADGDHLELGRLRKHLLVAVLVEQDSVVHLLLVLALRPLPVKGVGHSSQCAAA